MRYIAFSLLTIILLALILRLLSRKQPGLNQVQVKPATLEESLAARDELDPGWRERVRRNGS